MSEQERANMPFTGLISFLRAPVCSDLNQLNADIAILGAPTDEGTTWGPGARYAPRVIREMSVRGMNWGMSRKEGRFGYYDIQNRRHFLEREFREERIVDCGDADIIFTRVEDTFDNITRDVRTIVGRGAMPVILGGDHAITYPVVRAFEDPIDVIHFDAHLDYWPFEHGATLTNGTPIRLVGQLPNVGRIIQVGIRSLRHRERDHLDSLARGNDVVSVRDVRHRGVADVLGSLEAQRKVYVSIDIDVLDMPLVPGCSSAEVGGFDYYELLEALESIASTHEVVGFDLVEVNPMLDGRANNTSLIASQLVQEFLARVVEQEDWKTSHRVGDLPITHAAVGTARIVRE